MGVDNGYREAHNGGTGPSKNTGDRGDLHSLGGAGGLSSLCEEPAGRTSHWPHPTGHPEPAYSPDALKDKPIGSCSLLPVSPSSPPQPWAIPCAEASWPGKNTYLAQVVEPMLSCHAVSHGQASGDVHGPRVGKDLLATGISRQQD